MAHQQHNNFWLFLLIALTLLSIIQILEAGNTKIAYKKPIYGKLDAVNEKYLKLKQENERKAALRKEKHQSNDGATTTTTTTSGLTDLQELPHVDAYYNSTKTISTTAAPKYLTTTTTFMPSSTDSNLPAFCTCGIFLSSQIQRGQSQGEPVITYELDRVFPCNIIGQRQCQTKCLEKIVQHLPNAANILCATLDRDCRKERAYLFVKNCSHKWWNTTLAAGREYCCKGGQPYQCPLV